MAFAFETGAYTSAVPLNLQQVVVALSESINSYALTQHTRETSTCIKAFDAPAQKGWAVSTAAIGLHQPPTL